MSSNINSVPRLRSFVQTNLRDFYSVDGLCRSTTKLVFLDNDYVTEENEYGVPSSGDVIVDMVKKGVYGYIRAVSPKLFDSAWREQRVITNHIIIRLNNDITWKINSQLAANFKPMHTSKFFSLGPVRALRILLYTYADTCGT